MNKKQKSAARKLLKRLNNVKTAQELQDISDSLKYLRDDVGVSQTNFGHRDAKTRSRKYGDSFRLLRDASNALLLDIKDDKGVKYNDTSSALYLLNRKKSRMTLSSPKVVEKIEYAKKKLKEAINVTYKPEDIVGAFFASVISILFGIIASVIGFIVPLITQAERLGWGSQWGYVFDFDDKLTAGVFMTLAAAAANLFIIWQLYLRLNSWSYSLRERPFYYAYGVMKLLIISICLYLTYIKFPDGTRDIVIWKGFTLSFFWWTLFQQIFEIIMIFKALCIIYFDINVRTIGYILLLPINIALYPINLIIDFIYTHSNTMCNDSMRFIDLGEEISFFNMRTRHGTDYEKKVDYSIKTKEIDRKAKLISNDVRVPVFEVNYKEEVPEIVTQTKYIPHTYSEFGKETHHSKKLRSISTRLIFNDKYSFFDSYTGKEYKS